MSTKSNIKEKNIFSRSLFGKELKKETLVINARIDGIEDKIDRLEEKLDGKFDKVMKHLVGIAGKVDDLTLDYLAANQQLDNHEERIDTLETVVLVN